jgi:hypothetical protein
MQEHPHLIKRVSAWIKKYSWAVPAHTFLKYFGKLLRRHLIEGIHSRVHLYCIIDRKAFNSFNDVR